VSPVSAQAEKNATNHHDQEGHDRLRVSKPQPGPFKLMILIAINLGIEYVDHILE
jgi:hypothetical protein